MKIPKTFAKEGKLEKALQKEERDPIYDMLIEFGRKEIQDYTGLEELHKEADKIIRNVYKAINPKQLTEYELTNLHRLYIIAGMYTTKLYQYARSNDDENKSNQSIDRSLQTIKELVAEDKRKKK
ncbi:MAG: hypothetical protein KKA79_10765 [Nanoarchaeota archaeon]|nr:hypothetical protein [Nanoarchaeota archaeon]MCG2717423.1 hypothetical protein [Nanoarchaeota archaeon]